MEQAIEDVSESRAQRICAPGLWVVWREGDRVCVELKA
jgi:hypothetical protein